MAKKLTNGEKFAATLFMRRGEDGRLHPISPDEAAMIEGRALHPRAGAGWHGTETAFPISALIGHGLDIAKWDAAGLPRMHMNDGLEYFVIPADVVEETGYDPFLAQLARLKEGTFQTEFAATQEKLGRGNSQRAQR